MSPNVFARAFCGEIPYNVHAAEDCFTKAINADNLDISVDVADEYVLTVIDGLGDAEGFSIFFPR